MKAAVVYEAGGSPVWADFADPEVKDGQAEVALVGAGVHAVVRSRVAGRHYSVRGSWPAVPGVDAVARTADGRLVYTGFVDVPWGTMAERLAVPGRFGVPVPESADPLAVAAGVNPGLSSWLPLARRADEVGSRGLGTVVVLGATGIAGGMAVENAYALGADAVVAVGRNGDRLAELTAADPDRTLRTVSLTGDRDTDSTAVVAALAGRPPSVVIDFCWGPVAETTWQALGHPGLDVDDYDVRFVQVGTTAGPEASLPGALLRSRNLTLSGSGLGGTPVGEIISRLPEFLDQIAAGRVHVSYTAFPLSHVAEAWALDDGTRAVVVPD